MLNLNGGAETANAAIADSGGSLPNVEVQAGQTAQITITVDIPCLIEGSCGFATAGGESWISSVGAGDYLEISFSPPSDTTPESYSYYVDISPGDWDPDEEGATELIGTVDVLEAPPPPPPPTLNLSGPLGVPLNGTNVFTLTVSASGTPQVVQLSLSTRPNTTGSASFLSGAASMTVNVPPDSDPISITVSGTQASSTANNIVLTAAIQGAPDRSVTASFSVVSVTISINPTGRPDADDAVPTRVNPNITSLGAVYYGPDEPECAIMVELVGTVAPSNYAGAITLRRTLVQRSTFAGSSLVDSRANFDDTSNPIALYQNIEKAKVFDIDYPGVVGTRSISRYRGNFSEYAVLGDITSTIQTSSAFSWYAAASCGLNATGGPMFDGSIPNDNNGGKGTIKVTWNLQ